MDIDSSLRYFLLSLVLTLLSDHSCLYYILYNRNTQSLWTISKVLCAVMLLSEGYLTLTLSNFERHRCRTSSQGCCLDLGMVVPLSPAHHDERTLE
jgi:hypothetical protein